MRRREKHSEQTIDETLPSSEVNTSENTEDESAKWRQLSMPNSTIHQDDIWKNISVIDQPLPSRKERFSKPEKPKKSKEKHSSKKIDTSPTDPTIVEDTTPVATENSKELTATELIEPLDGISELIEEIEARLAIASTEENSSNEDSIDEALSMASSMPIENEPEVVANEVMTHSANMENKVKVENENLGKKQKAPKQKKQLAKKTRGKLPLGMVFDGNTLIFTEIQSIKNGYRARKLVIRGLSNIRFPIDDDKANEFTEILREILKREQWKKRKVVMSAPSEYVMLRHITVPKMAKKVLTVAIKSEVDNNVSFPFENPRYDYVLLEDTCIAEPGEEHQDVIVVAAPGLDLERYVNCARQAGFVPQRIEPGILGIQRLIMNSVEKIEKKQLDVVLHLRFNGTEFGFFEGENLLFMRHMDQKPADYPHQEFQNFGEVGSGENLQSNNQVTSINLLPGEVEDFDVHAYAADLGYEIDRSLNFVHYNLIKNDTTVPLLYLISAMLEIDPIVTALQDRLEQEVRVIESQLLFERPEREANPDATPWTVESARFAATALGMSLPEVSG